MNLRNLDNKTQKCYNDFTITRPYREAEMFSDIFRSVTPILKIAHRPCPLNAEDQSYGVRTVEHYELEYVFEGSGVIVVDGIPHPVTPHALHFRRPGMVVEGIGIYKAYHFLFDLQPNGSPVTEMESLPTTYPLADYGEIRSIFERLYKEYDTAGDTQFLRIQILILQLFEYMICHRNCAALQKDDGGKQNIQKSVEYIRKHFGEEISLSLLAKVAGYSIYHYTRVFKHCTGMSPIHFLNNYRLNCAKHMILTENIPLSQIADTCGFHQYAYFFRLFKAAYGCSPTQFRNSFSTAAQI